MRSKGPRATSNIATQFYKGPIVTKSFDNPIPSIPLLSKAPIPSYTRLPKAPLPSLSVLSKGSLPTFATRSKAPFPTFTILSKAPIPRSSRLPKAPLPSLTVLSKGSLPTFARRSKGPRPNTSLNYGPVVTTAVDDSSYISKSETTSVYDILPLSRISNTIRYTQTKTVSAPLPSYSYGIISASMRIRTLHPSLLYSKGPRSTRYALPTMLI